MFQVERRNNVFEFSFGPNGSIIRTTAPGEKPRVVDLQGRFPLRLYNKLSETTNPKSTVYGSVALRLPHLEESPSLMVYPHERNDERWIRIFWFEPNGFTTKFEIELRAGEVKQLLRYMEDYMTC